jgi:hypothetical protein
MLDFPNAPSVGQTFLGLTWDGVKWASASSTNWAPISNPIFQGDPRAPTPPSGDADNSIATTAFVQSTVAPAWNNVGRNFVHNAQMNIWQRGNPGFTTNVYTADRWAIYSGGGDTVGVSRQPFAVGGLGGTLEDFKYVLSNNFTSVAAGENVLYQNIEDVTRLSGKTVTVSFWANNNVGANKFGVCFDQRMGTGGSPSADVLGVGQSITLSTSYQRYSLTFTIPSLVGKTLGTNGDSKTQLSFWYSCGLASDAVRSGNIGQQPSAYVNITGVQVEVGAVMTPLERLDPVTDLQRCQRFYNSLGQFYQTGYATAAAGIYMAQPQATMRAAPSVVVAGGSTYNNLTGVSLGSNNTVVYLSGTVTTTGAYSVNAQYTLSADL